MVGRTLGHYEIIEPLGAGGTSECVPGQGGPLRVFATFSTFFFSTS